MKIARITVSHKGGFINNINNYRPILILPCFLKIVEKVINNRLVKYLNRYNLLSEHQYGCQKGKSTESALLNIREKILANIENQLYTVSNFLDFKNAFDLIKHEILFAKLPGYGIKGVTLNLIQSYLCDRSQFVLFNNIESNLQTIMCGVPQDSILGPVFF